MSLESKKTVFTFWEPKDNIYPYIQLCIDTWKKYLGSSYEIVILNYDNLYDYIPKDAINPNVFKYCSLPQISDVISVAVLLFNGGIYLDADTIITQSEIPYIYLLSQSDLIMFNNSSRANVYLACLMANPGSKILKIWLDTINEKVDKLPSLPKNIKVVIKLLLCLVPFKFLRKRIKSLLNIQLEWDFCGNSIINKLIKESGDRDVSSVYLKGYEFAELLNNPKGLDLYRDFYFTNRHSLEEFNELTAGVTALQNSWTPKEYKDMDRDAFLSQDILLAKVIKKHLEIKTAVITP